MSAFILSRLDYCNSVLDSSMALNTVPSSYSSSQKVEEKTRHLLVELVSVQFLLSITAKPNLDRLFVWHNNCNRNYKKHVV